MASYAVYYVDDEGLKEYVETFTEPRDAYIEKDRLQAEVDEDEDAGGVRVIVVEEPA